MSDPGITPSELYDFACAADDVLWQEHSEDLLRLQVSSRSFQQPGIVEALVAGGIDAIPAADLVADFRKRFNQGNVGVFFDAENIRLKDRSSGFGSVAEAVSAVRERLAALFGSILVFNLYSQDSEFQGDDLGGATHCITPHMRRTEVADKMILVDAISFAFEHQNPIVAIASCDSDFSSLLSRLQLLGVRTVAITADGKPVRSMRSVAAINLSFPSDFQSSSTVRGGAVAPPRQPSGLQPTGTAAGGGAFLSAPMPRSTSSLINEAPMTLNGNQQQPNHHHRQQSLNTPSDSNLTAPYPRSQRGGFRPPHIDVPAAVASLSSVAADDDDEDGEEIDQVQTLLHIMKKLTEETGNRRIRRNVLGQAVKNRLGPVNLSSLVSRAVVQNVVDVGGSGALSWVGLLRPNQPPSSTTGGGSSSSRGGTPRNNNNDNAPRSPKGGKNNNNNNKGADAAVAAAQAVAAGATSSTHPSHTWQPAVDAGNTREYWLSYRLLKDRLNSQAILGIKPASVQPYTICDTEDGIAPQQYTRRAFGPFNSELECSEFASGFANFSWAAPRVLLSRPCNPTKRQTKQPESSFDE